MKFFPISNEIIDEIRNIKIDDFGGIELSELFHLAKKESEQIISKCMRIPKEGGCYFSSLRECRGNDSSLYKVHKNGVYTFWIWNCFN